MSSCPEDTTTSNPDLAIQKKFTKKKRQLLFLPDIKPTKMKLLILPIAAILFSWSFSSCKSSSGPTFCDTTCASAPIKFQHNSFDSPYVNITLNNCLPDTITWSHRMLATKRKMGFRELVGKEPRLNKDYIKCYFNDTSYAWLRFNDCISGRGYLVKLPYSKTDKWSIYTSALNDLDPKFHVEDGLIAYYDETFIYVQELATGKVDKMVMNKEKKMDIDHDNIHKSIDSIHVTRSKIWANVNIDGKWTDRNETITLE
jgi:hypothetical protein